MELNRRNFVRASSLTALAAAIQAEGLTAAAQQPAAPPAPAVFTPLRRNVGIFHQRGGTIGWLVSADGLLVVDSQVAFMGSQNLIDSSYLMPANLRIGRHWHDLNIEVSGPIISSLEAVFALDWLTETGESLADAVPQPVPEPGNQPLQLLPSGPGYRTMPNLRLFTALIHRAQHKLSITSPYFVPEESLLDAVTSAAYRGVEVELFVSEGADQFIVQHAQASYYQALLEAGVRIFLYPKPTVLHAKFFTVDDVAGVVGSSNMDYRSFGLDYEISLLGTAPEFVAGLQRVADDYRRVCRELTAEEWAARSRWARYTENVTRLMAALQ